jgi:hypothetical protein
LTAGGSFVNIMKPFIKNINSSKENPSLLLIEMHESQFSIATIVFMKEHGVTVLKFPLQSSHKLQPMDVSVYFPFKAFYDVFVCSWLNR